MRGYGWTRDVPDIRDHHYIVPAEFGERLPNRVDLREECPSVYDQGHLQSCTANAIAAAIQFVRRKEGLQPAFEPSRLFVYYNARALRGSVRCDNGSQIRDGVKSVVAKGVCPEHDWPYHPSQFDVTPPPGSYRAAAEHRAIRYQRIQRDPDLVAMKACLASGYPFVFGMAIYEDFESAKVERSGAARLPTAGEHHVGHGHAVLAVGYDDGDRRFMVRNSWGPEWGKHGYFTLPFEYLAEPGLSDDFWTIRAVTD